MSGTPSTISRTSLIHIWRLSPGLWGWPKAPVIGRVAHMRPMGLAEASGAAMSPGPGTSQLGGPQTSPAGASVTRRNWHDALAMETPPEMNSASATLMRPPSRTRAVLTSIGSKPGSLYMSTVRRAGTKPGSP